MDSFNKTEYDNYNNQSLNFIKLLSTSTKYHVLVLWKDVILLDLGSSKDNGFRGFLFVVMHALWQKGLGLQKTGSQGGKASANYKDAH